MNALLQDHSEANALVLRWQDGWTVVLDDAFAEGGPLLDAAVAEVVAQVPLFHHLLGHADGPISQKIGQWKRAVIDPHLRAAAAELSAGTGTALMPWFHPPALGRPPRPWLPWAVMWMWFVITCLLVVATVATTAAFTLVPVMNILSTIVGFVCGICLAMFPGRFLRARAAAHWKTQAQEAAVALRAQAFQVIKDAAAGCLISRR